MYSSSKLGKARSGNTIMWALLIMVVGVGLIYFLNTQTVVRTQVVALDKKKRRARSILEAVYTRVLLDIRSKVAEQHKCDLNMMIGTSAADYIKKKPKIFPKETVYIEEFDSNNRPTGRFESTETNPIAWIEKAPGTNPGLYLIIVQTSVCPRPVTNRNYTTVADSTDPSIDTEEKQLQYKMGKMIERARPACEYNGNCSVAPTWTYPACLSTNSCPVNEINWKQACPLRRGEKLKQVEYRGFFDTRSMAADYVLYVDRSEMTNTAVEEPSIDDDVDLESRVTKSEITGLITDSGNVQASMNVGGILRKRTGANDDTDAPINPFCSQRLRSGVENALDSILLTDPCARVTAYMVAGSGAALPPNNIRCLGPAAVCNRTPGAKGWDLSSQRATILSVMMGAPDGYYGGNAGMCAVRPAGRFSLMNVFDHYKRWHQPSIDAVDDASRGLRRMLMVIGDGVAMGGDSNVDGESMIPAQSQDISGMAGTAAKLSDVLFLDVFSNKNCAVAGGVPNDANAQFFVEGRGLGALTGKSVFAGDKIFVTTAGTISPPTLNPWKRRVPPQPPGTTAVRSVVRMEDGVCMDIIQSDGLGHDDYVLPNYPYYLKSPVLMGQGGGRVRDALDAYNPYKAYQLRLTDKAGDLNPDLRNGFAFFPLVRADLDEDHIYNATYTSSTRPLFLLTQNPDNLTSSYESYLKVFSGLDAMPEGSVIYGITTDPAR